MKYHTLTRFKEAIHAKDQVLNDLFENGEKAIGYFCTYTPIEIIHAAGFIPVRVAGGSGIVSMANNHVPSFTCPYLRKAFESGARGVYQYLSGIVQGYTCDAACGLINIWKENIGGELFHTVPLPYNDTQDARRYLKCALEELTDKLQSSGGRNIHPAIENSVHLYESIRKKITFLYEKRTAGRLPLPASDFYTIIQAGFFLPPETYHDMLNMFIEEIEKNAGPSVEGIPVFVSGSIIEELEYFDIIESAGGRVVGDDLCTGMRHFDQPSIEKRDPIDRIIDRHFKRAPCPARSRATQRARRLKDLADKTEAKGLICLFQKFCTPHLADYPVIRDGFHKEGIPTLMLEMDETGEMKSQVQTRIEGFFEMME